jgi:hypothetical protein
VFTSGEDDCQQNRKVEVSGEKVEGDETVIQPDAGIPFFKAFKPEQFTNSEMAAKELFKLLIKPFPASKFFQ